MNGVIIIEGAEASIVDLYNVDYVCKIEVVNNDYIIEKINELDSAPQQS